ncbi:hypothetical protein [Labilibaculum antarcticum]|uniref:Uncharacterized protein n=1 Tax=Labilibaculum antarcticum TaxID=1717717 RepID=A0A1Y1CH24_9BACT|nr:hypothetical protein [Labilibaculum antarcticum]BAX79634.1 hypothetical protein ALGA_1248 [Labilibaculum antarcticum]
MKKTLFILFAMVVGFTSCDKVNDLKTKDFYDIELSKNTLVTVNTVESASLKIAETYPFSETINLGFADIEEIKDYLNKLEAVDVTSVNCKITNLTSGEIESLTISVPDLNFDFDIPTVSLNQSLFVNFSTEQLDAIANTLLLNKNLEILITGTVTEQPVSFNIEITALVDVEVEVL